MVVLCLKWFFTSRKLQFTALKLTIFYQNFNFCNLSPPKFQIFSILPIVSKTSHIAPNFFKTFYFLLKTRFCQHLITATIVFTSLTFERIFCVVVAQNKGFVQSTQNLTYYHWKKNICEQNTWLFLNHHLPPPDANAATSNHLRWPRGVALATSAERERGREIQPRERVKERDLAEREKERDLAIFWAGARPPLVHEVAAQPTPSHLGWPTSHPRSGSRVATPPTPSHWVASEPPQIWIWGDSATTPWPRVARRPH